MWSGTRIPGESVDADSRPGPDHQAHEGQRGFWCRMPAPIQGTKEMVSIKATPDGANVATYTLGEKLMSLIMRFLLHRSS